MGWSGIQSINFSIFILAIKEEEKGTPLHVKDTENLYVHSCLNQLAKS